ncbi:MAG: hypothetical protein ACKO2G_08250 [Verrucomicrobiales bacterium]
MLDPRVITKTVAPFVGLVLAVILGSQLVTDRTTAISWLAFGGLVVFCIYAGKSIWLLLPFMANLEIGLRLPGQPDSMLLGQMIVLGFCMILFLMRKLPLGFEIKESEIWMLAISVTIVQAYLRNPVGLNIFGGSTVGGRPYFIFGLTVITALLLASLRVPVRELKLIIPLSIAGGLGNALVALASVFSPTVAYYTGAAFNRTDETNYENFDQVVDTRQAGRNSALSKLGPNLALWVSIHISPVRAILRPLYAILLLAALVAAMLGGFRSGLLIVVLTLMVGTFYRNGIAGVLAIGFVIAIATVILAFVNLVSPLPPNVQRALTFLPGTWEQRYKDDAEGSTDWRVEIWKEALGSERWIRNKILGDGLGFTAADLKKAALLTNSWSGRGWDLHREQVLINGDYHSVIVSTVRTSGYLGLIIFFVASIRIALMAHRLIRKWTNTPWMPVTMLVGIPLIYGPFWIFLSATTFVQAASGLIMGAGMLRLLEKNLPAET